MNELQNQYDYNDKAKADHTICDLYQRGIFEDADKLDTLLRRFVRGDRSVLGEMNRLTDTCQRQMYGND